MTITEKALTAEQIVELKIREAINKPEGVLSTEDLLQVTALSFYGIKDECGCALVNLHGLAGCTNIEELDVMGNELTDISTVGDFKKLKKLELHGNQLEDGQLQYLDGLTELTHLSLGDNQLTRIPDLKQYPKLNELSLCGLFQHDDLSGVADAKDLQVLDIRDCRYQDLSALEGLEKLEWVKNGEEQSNVPYSELERIAKIFGERFQDCSFGYDQYSHNEDELHSEQFYPEDEEQQDEGNNSGGLKPIGPDAIPTFD